MSTHPFKSLADLPELYPIPPEDTDANYFESLGRFIAAYTLAEAGVHELVRRLSNLSDAKARVIFAGMRLGDLAERIRAITKLDQTSDAAKIDENLIQLDTIAEVRNKLVHRHVSYQGGTFIVTNSFTAKTVATIQAETFSRTDLDNMASDCRRIFLFFANYPTINQSLAALLSQPWLYKRAPPAPPKKSPRKAQKSRRPPPDASQA